ncbi:MAG: Plastocyanin [Chroococcidiopsis sp. SAG 2025]|uniref:plastocyanin/azurin family copper-binding protein n=1 Tax=Chroococcidiopsis sp. SAG 2025 TaxID=171389 RepID=UPI0029370896|nr:plastocyanin/azurin family copper-binding protein [Chroococcidiopsis sp. SAG 2025]MDV2996934.1 Plastocyanin [Chroococcidiopsis sp. SAG 2025]
MSNLLKSVARAVKAIALMVLIMACAFNLMSGAAWASAAKVLIAEKQGKPVFEPATVTIKSGDYVEWSNNLTAGTACNVVFDQVKFNRYPTPADENQIADSELFSYLSHQELLNNPKESFRKDFNVPAGEYTYVCEPYENAGVTGKVVVQSN